MSQKTKEDALLIIEDDEPTTEARDGEATVGSIQKWKLLIVDDDPLVHKVTTISLKQFTFEGEQLEISHAYSGKEALEILDAKPDIAVLLLDVIMETDDAGLQTARGLREKLGNYTTRIILRTGQPGEVPEQQIIQNYDIHDYKEKTELTQIKLHTLLFSALRSYRDILENINLRQEVQRYNTFLEKIVDQRTQDLQNSKIELERLNQEHHLILSTVTEGILEVDDRGNCIFANPAATKILGCLKEDLLQHSHHRFIHESMPHNTTPIDAICQICQTIKEGSVQHVSHGTFFKKDQTSFPVAYSSAPIQEDGRIRGTVITFRDISEQQYLQAQLQLAQKLESIGQLAAGIAHEINTPIQFIGNNILFFQQSFSAIQEILATYQEILTESQQYAPIQTKVTNLLQLFQKLDIDYLIEELPSALEQTNDGIDRITIIVQAMKDFSHPGAKQIIPVDLNKTIGNIITISRSEWKYVAELTTDFDKDLPLVSCSPDQINQVILNIIINATHAIKEAGSTTKDQPGTIHLCTHQVGDQVELQVSDTGRGIPEHCIHKIFDPFFTTKPVGQGTGQGLAIAYDIIVNKHHGAITVTSTEGKGTIFTIRLPIFMPMSA